MTSQNIKKYLHSLGSNPEYTDLLNQANRLNKMEDMLAAACIIPTHLNKHCKLGPLTHGQLTLLAENASVASKLKHLAPSLLQKIQKLEWGVTSIRILVHKPDYIDPMSWHQKKAPKSKKPKINRAAIKSLNCLARSLPDSELKHSIRRLLKHQD